VLIGKLASIATEVCRVAIVLPFAEAGRLSVGPRAMLAGARALGLRQRRRDPAARRRLRRVIGAIDKRIPGGANCYRRSLVELALDRGAAGEKLLIGLMRTGDPKSGHAWLESHGAPDRRYDAVMAL
jgi:hypothetical protein